MPNLSDQFYLPPVERTTAVWTGSRSNRQFESLVGRQRTAALPGAIRRVIGRPQILAITATREHYNAVFLRPLVDGEYVGGDRPQ